MKIDMKALRSAEADRGLLTGDILAAVQGSLLTAYKANGGKRDARVEVDSQTGAVKVYAHEVDSQGGVISEWDDTPQGFGWIAFHTARRVIRNTPLNGERDELAERVYGIVKE